VTVVLRRQKLLAPLEGEPFVPVQEPAPAAQTEPVPARQDGGDAAPADEAAYHGDDEVVEHQVAEDHSDAADDDADDERELATASAGPELPQMLGGAHVPADVVPARPEPFLPKRQAEFDEVGDSPAVRPVAVQAGPSAIVGDVMGATAVALDAQSSVIERDPNVNRSLMLRLIAGVRGL
jgi:hypothetical protein